MEGLPPWLAPAAAVLEARIARAEIPQALLIYGPEGVGRRQFADWLAERLLPSAGSPGTHPDLFRVTPPEDKKIISVEQIRDLIEFLGLTSFRGGRKVAVISPAEAMNLNAANSLLKTLEEPAGASTIILVAGALSRLPPTIVSRCERLRLAIPHRTVAVAWLRHADPAVAWEVLLDFCGGAPLRALDLAGQNFAETTSQLAADLGGLMRRDESAPAVARRWAKLDPQVCLRWLYWRGAELIRDGLAGPDPGNSTKISNSPLKNAQGRLNMAACYAYLDRLQHAYRFSDRSLNAELQFTDLLMWWYGLSARAR